MKRDEIYRDLVQKGVSSAAELGSAYPVVSPELQRIYKKFARTPKVCAVPLHFRLVNHFKTGADPEFVLAQQGASRYSEVTDRVETETQIAADQLGLKTGRAFGADMNGRLVEIRPHPSRNQLEVLSSILLTFRWMILTAPKTGVYGWKAGAFQFRDSLGGHVHFGRKRPTRRAEVVALDKICAMLTILGVYPANEVNMRLRGDARGQMYGQPGDFRLQMHGYEYRTFPSWLDSPLIAYITLVLSKLIVHDPTVVAGWNMTAVTPTVCRNRLINLLAYYKGRDDDARLLLFALKNKGFPKHIGGDFKARWGLDYTGTARQSVGHVKVIPMSIPSNTETVQELYEHIAFSTALKPGMIPSPTWSPVAPPKGYKMLLDGLHTTGAKGVGEMLWNVCYAEAFPVTFMPDRERRDYGLQVGNAIARELTRDWRDKIRKICPKLRVTTSDHPNDRGFVVPAAWREGDKAQSIKKVLLSGAFPIWDVGKVTPESLACWQGANHATTDKRELRGKVLFATKTP